MNALRGQIKLVVLDLDGTALNEEKELSPRTLAALAGLRERGIQYTFASARTPMMMGVYCKQARVTLPVITLDGAEITGPAGGAPLSRRPLPDDAAAEVAGYCHRAGLDYTFYTGKAAYLRRDTRRLWRMENYNRMAAEWGVPPIPTAFYEEVPLERILREQVLKIFVDNPDEGQSASLLAYLSGLPAVRPDCSEGRSVTVLERGASKGGALADLSRRLGIHKENICCFGDYYNDIGMLAFAAHSVAMGNAPKQVKDAARYLTDTNSQDGAAVFLENHLLTPV